MLKRTGFSRKLPERQPLPAPRPVRQVAPTVFALVGQPKENPVRSEAYRRLVAQLPCANCAIEGLSQAAHPPPTGKGIKEDDRMCFPLCCATPGVSGCHFNFDQGKLMTRAMMRQLAAEWAADTRDTIEGNGMWPKGLAKYVEPQ
jgi:hypothetical protein